MTRLSLSIVGGAAALLATGCSPPAADQSDVPSTAATQPEGQNETTGSIEPSVGSDPKPGGGVPDASQPEAAPNADGTNPTPPLADGTPPRP